MFLFKNCIYLQKKGLRVREKKLIFFYERMLSVLAIVADFARKKFKGNQECSLK